MRRMNGFFAVALLVAACSGGQSAAPGGAAATRPAASAGGGGGAASQTAGGGDLLAAATALKDVCPLLPMDLISPLVPNAAGPQAGQFPTKCTVSNQNQVVEVTVGPGDTGGHPVAGGTAVPDLGTAAFLEHLTPDDSYLTVNLSPDTGNVYVEVALHDGKPHDAEAIAIAKAFLAKLGGS